jgi:hypothetical protein
VKCDQIYIRASKFSDKNTICIIRGLVTFSIPSFGLVHLILQYSCCCVSRRLHQSSTMYFIYILHTCCSVFLGDVMNHSFIDLVCILAQLLTVSFCVFGRRHESFIRLSCIHIAHLFLCFQETSWGLCWRGAACSRSVSWLVWPHSSCSDAIYTRYVSLDAIYTRYVSLDAIYTRYVSLDAIYARYVSLDAIYTRYVSLNAIYITV